MERIRRLLAMIALFYATLPGAADLQKQDNHTMRKAPAGKTNNVAFEIIEKNKAGEQ